MRTWLIIYVAGILGLCSIGCPIDAAVVWPVLVMFVFSYVFLRMWVM